MLQSNCFVFISMSQNDFNSIPITPIFLRFFFSHNFSTISSFNFLLVYRNIKFHDQKLFAAFSDLLRPYYFCGWHSCAWIEYVTTIRHVSACTLNALVFQVANEINFRFPFPYSSQQKKNEVQFCNVCTILSIN